MEITLEGDDAHGFVWKVYADGELFAEDSCDGRGDAVETATHYAFMGLSEAER